MIYVKLWTLDVCMITYANAILIIITSSQLQIYVVDSLDRERIGKAKAEFQVL
jgi:hypothetical protein